MDDILLGASELIACVAWVVSKLAWKSPFSILYTFFEDFGQCHKKISHHSKNKINFKSFIYGLGSRCFISSDYLFVALFCWFFFSVIPLNLVPSPLRA